MPKQSVVRVVGPLAPYASGFSRELRRRGYTALSVAGQLRLMAHVSGWLAGEGLEAAAFTPERVEAFCIARRAEGYRGLRTAKALAPLQQFLQSQGVLALLPAPGPVSAEQQLLGRYQNYLVCERGLTERVVSNWVQAAGLFVAEHPELAEGRPAVGAAEVSAFCARELPRRSGSAARNLAAALRSLLRFLHVEGLVGAPLSAPQWRAICGGAARTLAPGPCFSA